MTEGRDKRETHGIRQNDDVVAFMNSVDDPYPEPPRQGQQLFLKKGR